MNGRRQNCLGALLEACLSLFSCSMHYCDNTVRSPASARSPGEPRDSMRTQLQRYRANQKRQPKRPSGYAARVNAGRKQGDEWFYGTQGPASPVRRIDPLTGEVTELIEAKGR